MNPRHASITKLLLCLRENEDTPRYNRHRDTFDAIAEAYVERRGEYITGRGDYLRDMKKDR